MEPLHIAKLSEYEIRADLGMNYKVLEGLYPEWSDDLHKKGNYIAEDHLLKIARNGLVRWYTNYETRCYPYHIDIPYYTRICEMYNPDNNELTSMACFRDFKIMVKLSSYFHKEDDFYENNNFGKFYSIISKSDDFLHFSAFLNGTTFQSIANKDCNVYMGYVNKGFSRYMETTSIDGVSCIEIALIILKDLYYNYLSHNIKSFEKTVWDSINQSFMKNLCIIFHRWKVILEKKTQRVIKASYDYSKSLYQISNMLDNLQSILLAFINKIVNKIHFSLKNNIPLELEFDLNNPNFDSYEDLINEIKSPESTLHCSVADEEITKVDLPECLK